ncbi:MAG: S9 family peptidase [Gemmatimonadaceae bacterium]|nr:S9 family peptidase [Gemmatimonadaceae bacterium]
MRTLSPSFRGRLIAGLLATIPVVPTGMMAQGPVVRSPENASDNSSASGKVRRTLTLADYGAWSRIVTPTLSADGRWMAFAYQPNDGDATLHLRALDAATRYSVPVGSAPVFTENGGWVGYFVSPASRRPGGAPGAGGGRPGGAPPTAPPGARPGGAAGAAPGGRRAEFRDLATGATVTVSNAATFKFSDDSKWVAVRTNKAQADARHNGADLILRELATGTVRNVGNVNLYEFDASGRYLAYTVDAADRQGNGIYLLDLASGESQALSSAAKDYDQLAWSATGANLTVLRGEKPDGKKLKSNTLLVWRDLGTPKKSATEIDPAKVAGFPADMVVSEYSAPRLSRDGSVLFFGIKEQESEPPRSEEAVANVDVWHFKDPEPQSVQIVRLQQERRSTWSAAYHLTSQKFVRLADSAMRTVTPTPNAKWGIGRLDAPYRGEVSWGGSRADYYRVNLATGERTLIAKALTRTMGSSPDSKWFLFLEQGKVYAFNLETAQRVQVDASAKRSFVDVGDDHPYEKPTYGVAGWSQDGKSVLLNHQFDIWQLALDGTKAVNLTGGEGEAKQIRFRLQQLNQPRGRGGPGGGQGGGFGAASTEDQGVDLTKPLVYSAYGEWTKQSGYFQGVAGKAPTALTFGDKNIGALQKAANADRVVFTQQTFTEYPDWWTSKSDLSSPVKVTDANPQLAEFAWGRKILVDYQNSKGVKLQGTLTLPANYEQGKKYPMIVYFYEKMSNTHHNFSFPAYDDRPHMSTYASDGYLVFQPDVVYETGRPGTSAVDCVTSAVKKVIELGYADPARIGLQGHSWSGYQSSYIITQTDMFAATVTGAPPTNLVSFYDQLYKQTGTVQQGIMELGQVRMGVDSTPWTAKALYESQSPVHNVQNIKTPFLILHGTADGAVDWVQGLEYFNAARRNGKNVIMLSYPDEPHHLGKRENQKDFQIRMKQYFDHYLKGTPAPQWMTNGVPQVRKGEPIR